LIRSSWPFSSMNLFGATFLQGTVVTRGKSSSNMRLRCLAISRYSLVPYLPHSVMAAENLYRPRFFQNSDNVQATELRSRANLPYRSLRSLPKSTGLSFSNIQIHIRITSECIGWPSPCLRKCPTVPRPVLSVSAKV